MSVNIQLGLGDDYFPFQYPHARSLTTPLGARRRMLNYCLRSCSKVDMMKKVFQGRDGLQLVFSGPRECTDILEKTELAATLASAHIYADIIVYVRP